MMGLFNKKPKKHIHNFRPLRPAFVANGKVYIVEYCQECGMYQYVRIPSNKMREQIEMEAEWKRQKQ